MKTLLSLLAFALTLMASSGANANAQVYVVTNDNQNPKNMVTVYSAAATGALTPLKSVPTDSNGAGNKAKFATVSQALTSGCLWAVDASGTTNNGVGDIAAFTLSLAPFTLNKVGNFASANGLRSSDAGGMGIVAGGFSTGAVLYVSYSDGANSVIDTWTIADGCKPVENTRKVGGGSCTQPAAGRNGTSTPGQMGTDLALAGGRVTRNATTLVVTFSDGSVGAYPIGVGTKGVVPGCSIGPPTFYTMKNGALARAFAGFTPANSQTEWVVLDVIEVPPLPPPPGAAFDAFKVTAPGNLGGDVQSGPLVDRNIFGSDTAILSFNYQSLNVLPIYVIGTASGYVQTDNFNPRTGVVTSVNGCPDVKMSGFGLNWTNPGLPGFAILKGYGEALIVAEGGYLRKKGISYLGSFVIDNRGCISREFAKSPTQAATTSDFLVSLSSSGTPTF